MSNDRLATTRQTLEVRPGKRRSADYQRQYLATNPNGHCVVKNVHQVVYELLRTHGLTTVFGNPGSTRRTRLRPGALCCLGFPLIDRGPDPRLWLGSAWLPTNRMRLVARERRGTLCDGLAIMLSGVMVTTRRIDAPGDRGIRPVGMLVWNQRV